MKLYALLLLVTATATSYQTPTMTRKILIALKWLGVLALWALVMWGALALGTHTLP